MQFIFLVKVVLIKRHLSNNKKSIILLDMQHIYWLDNLFNLIFDKKTIN